MTALHFDGRHYWRPPAQIDRIRLLLDGSGWMSLATIAETTGIPGPSAHTQLRRLTQRGFDVVKRWRDGEFQYRLTRKAGISE